MVYLNDSMDRFNYLISSHQVGYFSDELDSFRHKVTKNTKDHEGFSYFILVHLSVLSALVAKRLNLTTTNKTIYKNVSTK